MQQRNVCLLSQIYDKPDCGDILTNEYIDDCESCWLTFGRSSVVRAMAPQCQEFWVRFPTGFHFIFTSYHKRACLQLSRNCLNQSGAKQHASLCFPVY